MMCRLAKALYTPDIDSLNEPEHGKHQRESQLLPWKNAPAKQLDDFEYNMQLSQEILMSYRLLFGQMRGSRKLAKASLQTLKQRHDYDQLLDAVCYWKSQKIASQLPKSLWPISCRNYEDTLQEADTYSSQDDFPLLSQRLMKLQEFNLRQQPSRLRDLWRDRRNPLHWYTFWAVLVLGSVTILLALLQLIVAIIAIPLTSPACSC